ncbi:MAG: DEAD/DEAH box helicase family protein [candidate division NC10 bacterium]|nr:DEAD/DEAH box helicase family protein [candidate division NC10 bacterium]
MSAQGLRGVEWQISYGPADDRLRDFYLPALSRSVRFDRATGFFSSAALAIAAAGIVRLIQNGGRMRLLCGAQLSREDVEAIRRGEELGKRVGERMVGCLVDPQDQSLRARLEALAWMVAHGTLEIRVVLPKGPDGYPLPAEEAREYYHPKEGLFKDAFGDRIAFSGSSNESESSWQWNYEVFSVYHSWDFSEVYLKQVARRFEALWNGTEKDWIALPIPEAARAHLLKYTPERAPTKDPLEKPVYEETISQEEQNERILFQFVQDAPFLPNGHHLGAATSTVQPWPHQQRVADLVVQRFPEGFLLSDEVGLGKTIEAGLALRQLLLAGRVKRCLILTPKSVSRQWQEELYEKFVLNIPRYDGKTFYDVFDRELSSDDDNPWNAFPVFIASSQLAKRKDRQPELLAAKPWDLILVDEAHHARRKDFLQIERYRPNRLLGLLNALRDKARGLLLLTATPMQIHPVEVWDLLHLLGVGGKWGAGEENFLRFFEEMRKSAFSEVDWAFVLQMVRDELQTGGGPDPAFSSEALRQLGPVEWQQIQGLPWAKDTLPHIKALSEKGRAFLVEMVRRHTPLRRLAQRNTRSLLRKYQERGILRDTVPKRDPKPGWIPFREEEWKLYERIEEYISDFYNKYESERKGLGFIMTVYRRRLTSSFYAIQRSLERRLAFLEGRLPPSRLVDDDDLEQDDLELDVGEEMETVDRSLFADEIGYVKDFLARLKLLSGESKVERLLQDLKAILARRETVLIFTQYTDTMDYLRDQLREVYGSQVACYSGRGGERWDGTRWARTSKEVIKNLFLKGQEIKILLGTEAASEGLNLQTCGILINFDMPWNPMRVEQRIGRLDRIGQQHEVVWICNYFYEESVEATIYRRLEDRIDWFETVVGELQPILARVATAIRTVAMAKGAERTRRLEETLRELREQLEERQVTGLDLERYLEEVVAAPAKEEPPVRLKDLEALLLGSRVHGKRFRPHPEIGGAYLLSWEGEDVGVTFDPALFDRFPESFRLQSFGDEILTRLLAAVPEPVAAPLVPSPLAGEGWGEGAGRIVRCAAKGEYEHREYFIVREGRVVEIPTFAVLREALGQSGGVADPYRVGGEVREVFLSHVREARRRDREVEDARRRGAHLALEEEGRQLLLKAALIDLAIARQQELWDEPSPALSLVEGSAESSEDAVLNLRRKGFPFAPLLSLVSIEGLRPTPTDPFFVRIQGETRESLDRRMAALKPRIADVVKKLATFGRSGTSEPGAADNGDITVSITTFR